MPCKVGYWAATLASVATLGLTMSPSPSCAVEWWRAVANSLHSMQHCCQGSKRTKTGLKKSHSALEKVTWRYLQSMHGSLQSQWISKNYHESGVARLSCRFWHKSIRSNASMVQQASNAGTNLKSHWKKIMQIAMFSTFIEHCRATHKVEVGEHFWAQQLSLRPSIFAPILHQYVCIRQTIFAPICLYPTNNICTNISVNLGHQSTRLKNIASEFTTMNVTQILVYHGLMLWHIQHVW